METKTQLEQLVTEVSACADSNLGEKCGYLLLAYHEEDKTIESTFTANGKFGSIAECICACMQKNEVLANVIIAAANAVVQNRMIEAQMKAEAMADKQETKKKRTRKPKN